MDCWEMPLDIAAHGSAPRLFKQPRQAPERNGSAAIGGRSVQGAGPGLEGGHHALHRLVEQHADQLLQHGRAELEFDLEVDDGSSPLSGPLEAPAVGQMLERTIGIGHVDGKASAGRDRPGW